MLTAPGHGALLAVPCWPGPVPDAALARDRAWRLPPSHTTLTHAEARDLADRLPDGDRVHATLTTNLGPDPRYAADYGAGQVRKRAFLIASRMRAVELPAPTHGGLGLLPHVAMADTVGWGYTRRPAPTVTGGGTATGGAEPIQLRAYPLAGSLLKSRKTHDFQGF